MSSPVRVTLAITPLAGSAGHSKLLLAISIDRESRSHPRHFALGKFQGPNTGALAWASKKPVQHIPLAG
ncbi:hypothetical protein GGTG_07288 [Gaeumannomyces tritici R3-111a-1]|uniref:Uncharacterized protein n=1 Tax=Gaeumannomyces tritici (strain R3-111a-1) TaxID=644352 RepID=J3P191_GAET3|nr:hypothetical protein GGTG_07288 [Gaeumannomyces tritici R3-111a-1]EJT77376.1 hypothetical protein GGTG_07288 [Gaeumannomyces tritici R3-111a-1]